MSVQVWFWVGFFAFMLAMLALDLFVLNRKAHIVKTREALLQTGMWVSLAVIFGIGVYFVRNSKTALEFFTAYIVEYSLSVDNLFVFLIIFSYFKVPVKYEHKVLFWGILGALIMRITFILAGITLIQKIHWIIYIFGAFLIYTGIKILVSKDEEVHPEKNPVLKIFRKLMPVSKDYVEGKFFIKEAGRLFATPLFVVVLVLESTDVVFATDSVPAVLAITRDPFIAYTSNVFAILGLRSLFFALSGLMRMFHYLSHGVSFILVFVGVKMLISERFEIPSWISLMVIITILTIAIIASVIKTRREQKANSR